MSSRPRVVVAGDRIDALDGVAVATALARGFAEVAQVAVVPVAAAGPDLASAVAQFWGGAVEDGGERWRVRTPQAVLVGLRQPGSAGWNPAAGSADLGAWVAASLGSQPRVVIDLTGLCSHDGGAGLFAAAGDVLRGREVIGVVDQDELDDPATGLTGPLARRGYQAGVAVGDVLAADAALAAWAGGLGEGLDTAPGGGAAGGAGVAVLALGGRLTSGQQYCHDLAGLDRTLRAADMVVTCCADLSALDRGGPVVTALSAWAEAAQRPLLVFTTGSGLARRELRTMGIEAVHLLDSPVTASSLAATASRIAQGWSSSVTVTT